MIDIFDKFDNLHFDGADSPVTVMGGEAYRKLYSVVLVDLMDEEFLSDPLMTSLRELNG